MLGLLPADAPRRVKGAPQDWPQWVVLSSRVPATTAHFDQLPRDAQRASEADAARLLDSAALYLKVHARLTAAQPLAERALAIDGTSHGPDHPDVATRLNTLAGIVCDLGQPAQAQPLAQRALAITETAHGPDHPDVATRLDNLARILRGLGQEAEARPLAERALAIGEAVVGPYYGRHRKAGG